MNTLKQRKVQKKCKAKKEIGGKKRNRIKKRKKKSVR